MQIISTDKTVRSDTIEDIIEFNSQSLITQAKKVEQLVSMMPAKEGFCSIVWWHSRITHRKRKFEKQKSVFQWKIVKKI